MRKKGYGSKSEIRRYHHNPSQELVSLCPARQKLGLVATFPPNPSGRIAFHFISGGWGKSCCELLIAGSEEFQEIQAEPQAAAALVSVAGVFLLLGVLLLGRVCTNAGGAAREPRREKGSPEETGASCLLERITFKYISLKVFFIFFFKSKRMIY